MRNENKTLKKRSGKLSGFFDEYIYVLLAFLCSSVLMLLVYYCYEIIPFGGRTVLRMDLFHQYGPLFSELYDRLTQFKSLLYSWTTGGGSSFVGNYFNYLSSPIGAVIALIAGHENIPEAIGVMVLIKNALAASTFAYYLKKAFNKNDFTISAFGLMYAFCGFFIAYYWNIMWIDAMYLLPLVILGIERIINKRSCKLYVAALAFSFFANYYMSYMICIFSVIYFLVYFISNYTFKDVYADIPSQTDSENNVTYKGIHKFLYNRFLRSGVTFAVSSVVAAMLVAFALIPTYMCLKQCSATSGVFPEEEKFYNTIFDFIANHLAALEPTIRSSGDTVLPNVYCGILTVILIPLYAFCNKISAKERASHIIFLAIFFVGFNLNYANYILHAMHFPNDLPFRFSFIYSFLLLIMAYKVLVNIRSVSAKGIIGSGLGVLIFTVLVQEIGMSNVDNNTVYISVAFTAIYTIVLSLMRKKEYAQSAVALLLLCCTFAEVAVADIDHIKITQEKVNFVNGYNDFRALKEKLDEDEGTDMYRMELTKSNTIMDPSWFNYNGISVFSSMAYEKSANLQDKLGLDSNYINSYIYYSQTPVYNAMMGLKYLVRNDETPINNEFFDFVASCGKFNAYKNKYYLPIAYCVGENMTDFNSDYSNPFDVHNDFWYYATGMTGALKSVYASEYTCENVEDNGEFYSETFNYSKLNSDAEGKITLKYTVPENQNLYVYVKGSTIKNVNAYTEIGDFDYTQNIDEPYILDCGYCTEGDILNVDILIPTDEDAGYVECYVAGLDKDVLDAGYTVLQPGAMNIETFEETYIKGTVNVAENKMLFTSINYDEGWTVLVDGKKANTVKIGDALIGINLDEGEHTIEFSYYPQGLKLGIIISVATFALLILFLIFKKLLNKDKAPKKQEKVKIAKSSKETKESKTSANEPTGIEKMMLDDFGEEITIEQAEALIAPKDEYEDQLEKNAPTLSKADELLSTQKLDLKAILNDANNTIDNIEENE